MCKQALGL